MTVRFHAPYAEALKISIGSDHAGFEYKEKIRAVLTGLGHEVVDFGTFSATGTVTLPAGSEGVGTVVPGGLLAAPDDPSMN